MNRPGKALTENVGIDRPGRRRAASRDEQIAPAPDRPGATPKYRHARPRERPPRTSSRFQAWSVASAPLLGSRLFFPPRFDRAVADLLADPAAAVEIPPEHARWYFGASLAFAVDPARLTLRISDVVRDYRGFRWVGGSFLDAANWAGALTPLERSPVHREMRELVAADLDFRAIRAYRVMTRLAELGRPARRNGVTLAGPEAIDGYFRYCADLVESVRRHGIVSRRKRDILRTRWLKHRHARPASVDRAERDVGVAIGADGALIRFLGGKHRTAVAQALGLPSIPVELRCVHVGWLAGEMRRTGLPAHAALRQALVGFKSVG